MAASTRYTKPFSPRVWLPHELPETHPDLVRLQEGIRRALGTDVFRGHQVYRRRERWAVEAPLGTFTGDFGATTIEADHDALWALLTDFKKDEHGVKTYPFTPSSQIICKDGRLFLRERAVSSLAVLMAEKNMPTALLMTALDRYHTALVRREVNVFPPKTRPFVPLEERPVIKGHRARGPSWTPAEDQVLRNFFSRQPDGTRVRLSDAHWNMIINHPALKGRRTKSGILQRINILNHKLKKSLMVDGYLPAAAVVVWQRERLGERNRVPRFRPRQDGTYRDLKPSPPPPSTSTSETPVASTATPAPSPAQTAAE